MPKWSVARERKGSQPSYQENKKSKRGEHTCSILAGSQRKMINGEEGEEVSKGG